MPNVIAIRALLLFSLCCFSFTALALPPHHSGTFSSLNLGVRFSSIYQKRGVIIYRDFQIDPVISLFFFDDQLAFLGDSIDYQKFIFNDQIRFRTKISVIGDDPLFPDYESVRVGNVNRETTYEWSNGIDFYIPGYNSDYLGEFEFTWSKDLKAHSGNHLNLIGKAKLFDFDLLSTKLEPNLVASVGYADRAHNQYLYGPSANEIGFTDYTFGFWLALPGLADRHYPIVQLVRFGVLGEKNRQGDYATGKNEGYLLSFIASYPVLD